MQKPIKLDGPLVHMTESRELQLLEKEAWLDALEAAGVDSWEGIEVALEILENQDQEHNTKSTTKGN